MIRKIRSLVVEIGLLPALVYGTDRVLLRLTRGHAQIHLCYFMTQPVPDKRLLPAGMRNAITVAPIRPGDLDNTELPLTQDLLQARLERGVVCLGAYKDGRLIGFHCLSFERHDDELYRARFEVGPKGRAVWDFDIFILPTHRGGLSFAFLWDGVFEFLRSRDIRWLTSYIAATNVPSLKSHLRMGSIRLGSVIFLRVGRLQLMLSDRAPYLHASFAETGRPAFRLDAPEAR
jgi:hypothetical protein